MMRPAETDGTTAGLIPRLMDSPTAAHYLSISERSLRELVTAGSIRRVEIPLGSADLRRVLFDRQQLDALVDSWGRG